MVTKKNISLLDKIEQELNPFAVFNANNLKFIFKTIWRNLFVIIIFGLITALTTGYLSIKPAGYKAESKLRIHQIPPSDEYYSEHVSVEAEMEILKSYDLVSQTLTNLNTYVSVNPVSSKASALGDIWHGLMLKMEGSKAPETDRVDIEYFNVDKSLEYQTFTLHVVSSDYFIISDKTGNEVAAGNTGQDVTNSDGKITLKIKTIHSDDGNKFTLKTYSAYDFAKLMQSKLQVSRIGLEKFSGLIRVRMEHNDKDFTNKFLNEYVKLYRDNTLLRITKEMRTRVNQHEDNLKLIDAEILTKNLEMKEIQQKYTSIDHESESNLLLKSLLDLEKEYTSAKTSLGNLQASYTNQHPSVISLKKQIKVIGSKIARIKAQKRDLPKVHMLKFDINHNIDRLKEARILIMKDLVRLKSRLESTKNYVSIIHPPQTVHMPYLSALIRTTIIAFIFGCALTSLIILIINLKRGRSE